MGCLLCIAVHLMIAFDLREVLLDHCIIIPVADCHTKKVIIKEMNVQLRFAKRLRRIAYLDGLGTAYVTPEQKPH